MAFKNQQEFIGALEAKGELQRIKTEVDPYLEITEIADRISKKRRPRPAFRTCRRFILSSFD
jgi:4-hydroxy-3-polyprenylbenzoate decarboxylase